MDVRAAARGAIRSDVDFALPARCPGCGAICGEEHRFCLACWRQLQFLGEPCCACCAAPFDYDIGAGALCGACLSKLPAFDRMRAAVAYGDIARIVALKLKYQGRPGIAETMARLMERHLADAPVDALLVPVPLHRWRIWRRGYNQAALIASALARRRGLAARLDLLVRTRATPPMRGLGRRQRAETVAGAFAVDPRHRQQAAGRFIILIDDVFTTGATAGACARTLKHAGAARVDILTWARVVSGAD